MPPRALPSRAARAETVGVTDTEIKIGHTIAYSGPASSFGLIGRSHTAFFNMINEQGGVNGRKINFISYDDGYSPPRTVEQVRRLVEQDQVACLFNPLGTPTNSAVQRYLNQKKVPHLFLATGADKWGDYQNFPWTIGFQPSYRTEAQIYTKHILQQKPEARMGILYQNDDFGKDYPSGVMDVLGDRFDKVVVKAITYEVTDATVDSQINSLKAAGVDVLLTVALPKFAAMTIRKLADMNWKPLHYLTNVSVSVATVMQPAGPENGIGIISTNYIKDPTDPVWKDDAGMAEWRDYMDKQMPGVDRNNLSYVYPYGVAKTMVQTLKQCGNDLSRENLMKQATNIRDLSLPTLLPGIKVNTSPTNYHPIRAMQPMKWDGKTWVRFGDVIEGAST